jgi:hypothetical protein
MLMLPVKKPDGGAEVETDAEGKPERLGTGMGMLFGSR